MSDLPLWDVFGEDIERLEKLHACSGDSCQVCAGDNRAKADHRVGRTRANDYATSVRGAESVAYRAGSQKRLLMAAYEEAYPEGLTDDEAADAAGIPPTSCYWKRCGELRQDGVILVGESRISRVTRELRIVCRISPELMEEGSR